MKSIEHEIQKAYFKWDDYFIFDAALGELIWKTRPVEFFKDESYQRRWNDRYAGKIAGAVNPGANAYQRKEVAINGNRFKVHRIVYEMAVGPIKDGYSIDHIDGNPLNNRVENLRQVLHSENHRNRKIQSNNKTGYSGIRFRSGRYTARAKMNGVEKSLGSYETLQQALRARYSYLSQFGFTERHIFGEQK